MVHDKVRSLIKGCPELYPCVAFGVVNGSDIIGGVLFHEDRGFDSRVSIAFERPAFVPWRGLFALAFSNPERVRLTAFIDKKNTRSRKLCEALGFKMEGVHPLGVDGKGTAISYGMLRKHCRWLRT